MTTEVLLDIAPLLIVRIEPTDGVISKWPRIEATSRMEAFKDDQVNQVIQVYRDQLAMQRAYVSVFDCRLYRYPSMMQVYSIWSFVRSMREEFNRYLMCSVVILGDNLWSLPGNSFMELIRLVNQTDSPFLVCHEKDVADEFIESVEAKWRASATGDTRSLSADERGFVSMAEFHDFEDESEARIHQKCVETTPKNQYYQRRDLRADLHSIRGFDSILEPLTEAVILDIPAVHATYGSRNSSERPIFIVRSKEAAFRPEDIEVVEAALNNVLGRDEEFVALYDFRAFKIPPMSYVYKVVSFVQEREAQYAKCLKCSAVVLGDNFWSAAARKVVDILTKLSPPPCPLVICHHESVAYEFFEQHDTLRIRRDEPQTQEEQENEDSIVDFASVETPSRLGPGARSHFMSLDSFNSLDDGSVGGGVMDHHAFTPKMRRSTFFSALEVWTDRMKSVPPRIETSAHAPVFGLKGLCVTKEVNAATETDKQPSSSSQCVIA